MSNQPNSIKAVNEQLDTEMKRLDWEALRNEFASELEDGFDNMCKLLERCHEYAPRSNALEMLAALKNAMGGSIETSQFKRVGGVSYIVRRHEAFGIDELRVALFGRDSEVA